MGTNSENPFGIVECVGNVALLGGGTAERSDLERALALGPRLICADSGAEKGLNWGFRPELVIGDLDSVDVGNLQDAGIPTCFVDDQNSTDFEKCLSAITAPVIIGIGFMGLRLDHQLAALNALANHPEQRVILIGEVDICFLCPPRLRLSLPTGERFSVFPLEKFRCTSRGLRWALDELKLTPTGRTSVSNRVSETPVRIEVKTGKAVCILPKAHLELVVDALQYPEI